MDLEYNDMNIDPINFSYLINMPSQDFQNIVKIWLVQQIN